MRKIILITLLVLISLCLLGFLIYNLPPVQSRLAWRIDEVRSLLKSYISPPEKIAFSPQDQVDAAVQATMLALSLSATPPPSLTPGPIDQPATPTPLKRFTPLPSPTPTVTPTPLPSSFSLKGVTYTSQHGYWNYCAPANLTMALSFWGRKDDLKTVGEYLKPYDKDKNVMPYEMENYVHDKTDLAVVTRVAGDLDLVKRLIVSGFPVLIEKGAYIKDISGVESWMGHYTVVTGYDDGKQELITQDSYYTADYPVAYATFIKGWRSFNDTYLIIFPPDRQVQVMDLLGPQADETTNWQYASAKAVDETTTLTGVDLFFALFNRGTNLVGLKDYAGAALAYDQAFAIYATLPEDKTIRPYRILWYETGPYYAYFFTGRYKDVISMADATLASVLDVPALEESYVWKARAESALGNNPAAIADLRLALKYHPGFQPAVDELARLGG